MDAMKFRKNGKINAENIFLKEKTAIIKLNLSFSKEVFFVLKPAIDWDACVGCGACTEVCPEVFQLRDDKAYVIGPDKCNTCKCEEAVDICPVQAISVTEE